MVICRECGAEDLHISSWCHCHPIISCFIKIRFGLTFLVPAYPCCVGKEAILLLNLIMKELWKSSCIWWSYELWLSFCLCCPVDNLLSLETLPNTIRKPLWPLSLISFWDHCGMYASEVFVVRIVNDAVPCWVFYEALTGVRLLFVRFNIFCVCLIIIRFFCESVAKILASQSQCKWT